MMNGYMILAAVMLVVCVLTCMLLSHHIQKKMEATYQNLLQRLDRAIGGEIQDTAYDESMDAAVTERLNRVVQISRMNQEKAEKERDIIKSLISDISHQVRTPLTNIMLYVGLLKEQDLDNDTKLLVDKIGKQSEKLDFLIQSLAKLSRMETGMISVHPAKQCIQPVLDALKQQFGLKAAEKNIRFTVEDSSETAVFDCKWTIEAAANLTDNAIKYTPQEGAVRIRVIPYALFVRIDISDSGIGIAQSEQAAVFGRFYRSAKVCQTQGLGIGLYLAREIIRAQKGYIKVSSEIGNGSTFSIFLLRKEMQNETLSQK